MTKRNYIALAAAFNNSRPYIAQRANMRVWHDTRAKVMQVLATENPNFDLQRFIDATEKPQ